MHGTILALTLAAYLLTPSSLLSRLWNLAGGTGDALAPTAIQEKAGPGLDPSGVTVPALAPEAGPGLDPFGCS
jgi:hypothetical protein